MKSEDEIQKMTEDVVVAALRGGIILTYGEHVLLDEAIAEKATSEEVSQWN